MLLGIALVAPTLGCGGGHPPVAKPTIILISLDTFRADLLAMKREDGSPETPSLLRVAREGIWYTDAWAPMPFTLPSHMTMLSGLHPLTHGVVAQDRALAPEFPTLAEELQKAGYWTAGVATTPWLRAHYGFSRGFDTYRARALVLQFAPRNIADALAHLHEAPAGKPVFLFVHFYDAHADSAIDGNRLPYYSPPEYRRDLHPEPDDLCDARGRCAVERLSSWTEVQGLAAKIPEPRVDLYFQLYRRGVRYLDDELGRFFDELRRSGVWDRALVVITADHGEEFREHGDFQHGQVYRELLHVPLLVKLPDAERAGEKISNRAELADLAPTLLRRVRAEVPSTMLGRDLLSPEFPRLRPRELVSMAERPHGLVALRTPQLLVMRPEGKAPATVFDLARDPTEHTAAELTPERRAALLQRLRSIVDFLRSRGAAAAAPNPLTARELEEMKSLGYL